MLTSMLEIDVEVDARVNIYVTYRPLPEAAAVGVL